MIYSRLYFWNYWEMQLSMAMRKILTKQIIMELWIFICMLQKLMVNGCLLFVIIMMIHLSKTPIGTEWFRILEQDWG